MLKDHWFWPSIGVTWLKCGRSSVTKYLGWQILFLISSKINSLYQRLQVDLAEYITHDWNLRKIQSYYAKACFDSGDPGDRAIFMQLSLLQDNLLNGKVFCRQSAKVKSLWCLGRYSAINRPFQKMSLKWENKLENKWVQSSNAALSTVVYLFVILTLSNFSSAQFSLTLKSFPSPWFCWQTLVCFYLERLICVLSSHKWCYYSPKKYHCWAF